MWGRIHFGCFIVILGMQCWHAPASRNTLCRACHISICASRLADAVHDMETCKWEERAHLELHVGPVEVVIICILKALHCATEVARVVFQLMLQHTYVRISASSR